ncbi:RagB/SusD family nutrient uptake outer membrane protein [Arenitalea sp.]|nr:RagB/SusD family nutrient uptake outer membrane protein [Algibacter sp.]MDA9069812.1 RagB/SusD family nutrient uptake outer membrane protein [Algibacter sp.]
MKKHIIILLGFISLLGCEKDLLNQENPNTLTPDQFWKTSGDAQSAIIGAYSPLSGIFYHGRMWSGYEIAYSDENFIQGDFYGALSVFNINPSDGNFANPFAEMFKVIFRANLVLQNVPNIDMDATTKDNILGEAYFLRAYNYFTLVNHWENVPLVTAPASSLAETQQPPSSPDVIWKQIEADLTAAIPLLPTSWDDSNKGRVIKAAAAAFLGKSLLYQEKWGEAAAQFKNIIDNQYGTFDLMPAYKDNFRESSENNIESLFEIQMDLTGAWAAGWGADVPSQARYFSFSRDLGVGGASRMNKWVYDLFMKEMTNGGEIDPRAYETLMWDYPGAVHFNSPFAAKYAADLANYASNPTMFRMPLQNAKYVDPNNTPKIPFWTDSANNKRIMRFADVLLMHAEAENEANGATTAAYTSINRVRARVDMPDIPDNLSKEEFRQRVRDERTLELCNESQRPLDLKRWGMMPDRLVDNPDFRPIVIGYVEGRELFPIPQTEIDTNPAYKDKQNRGYE